MARTNTERFDEALARLKKVSVELSNQVTGLIHNKDAVGAELSLKGAGYWYSGSDDQHVAVRAYLLCLIAYGRPPFSGTILADKPKLDAARRASHGKSVTFMEGLIREFLPAPGASADDLATAAANVQTVGGNDTLLTITRASRNIPGGNPICYNGVAAWLYAAGFVSRRWLIKALPTLTAYTCNNILGNGELVDKGRWEQIPRGYIWNIQKQGDRTTCHWGVSLGQNLMAACNNSPGAPVEGKPFILQFTSGNPVCGIAKFSDVCKVCNNDLKYKMTGGINHSSGQNIVVRQINPTAGGDFY